MLHIVRISGSVVKIARMHPEKLSRLGGHCEKREI